MQPLIHIGIPAYNDTVALQTVIKYLQRQPYRNFKAFISENGTVPRPHITDIRFTYYRQRENIQAERNFEYTYNMAGSSPYFIWMSLGDVFTDNYITDCVQWLETHSEYICCAGVCDIDKQRSIEHWPRMWRYLIGVHKSGIIHGVFRNSTPCCYVGDYIASDWVHVAQLARRGKIKVLTSCTLYKDDNGSSSSRAKLVARWGKHWLPFEAYTAWQIAKRLPLPGPVWVMLCCKFLFNSVRRRIL